MNFIVYKLYLNKFAFKVKKKCMKQKPAELEGDIRQSHNNRYFNTPFSATDRKTGGGESRKTSKI